jgi:hypothetical protein
MNRQLVRRLEPITALVALLMLASVTYPTSALISAPSTQSASPIIANATGISLTFVDPKSGRVLWKLNAKSADASTATGTGQVVGTLHGVAGILYQNAKPVDRVLAQNMNADQATGTIVATGNVTAKSLTQVATSIRCDRLVWRPGGDSLVGTGNVVLHKGNFTQTGPSFQADTKMKKVVMPAPGLGRGGVKATLSP